MLDLPRSSLRAPLRAVALAGVLVAAPLMSGCGMTKTYTRGYILPEGALEQIPIGASQEQVLIILGTPSTVATVNDEVFYYISQKTQQTSFLPQKVTDQQVVAVYFDKDRRVRRLAHYGMKDGKVFDFISRTTAAGGDELSYLTYVFKILGAD
jgi:outer membrane protein assembly factor BamE (lipoprotein component of BamABCDE complex)